MAPNITEEDTAIISEKSSPWSPPSQPVTKESCHLQEPDSITQQIGDKMLSLYSSLKHYALRLYIICWHEISMDPAVRPSPWSPPVKGPEVKLSWNDYITTRRRRIFFLAIHILSLVGLYYCVSGRAMVLTMLWAFGLGFVSSIGVTAGAHRLWSHHSYKAKWPMRLLLAIFQTIGIQYSIWNWVRDHRLHHKYTDTDADPHNSTRGFFFSHIGWSLILPHPEVTEKVKVIDTSDVEKDWVVVWQYRLYAPLAIMLCYVIPTLVPWYFWGENMWVAHCVATQLRHVITLHGTFLINSVAHMWGNRPYDKNINPTENLFVSVASFGDGWHNYHHVFPWDYKNAELWNYKFNISTGFVDLCALIGWAYDLKTVPSDMIRKRVARTGDGTYAHNHDGGVWGWTDKDLPEEDKKMATILNKEE
uniref:Acyl-CoA Delta(11) desaturase n=1 Tax=Cacopsylla melanoneura TaxID=428564 RepID=A0A8D8QZ57_9HEMI